ncbi:hypothetical protein ACJX0J_006804 [Zea mays]
MLGTLHVFAMLGTLHVFACLPVHTLRIMERERGFLIGHARVLFISSPEEFLLVIIHLTLPYIFFLQKVLTFRPKAGMIYNKYFSSLIVPRPPSASVNRID